MRVTVREHVELVFGALQSAFPTPHHVKLRWRSNLLDDADNEAYGLCYKHGRFIQIDLDPNILRNWFIARIVLFEEYAHALTTRTDRMERHRLNDHDEEWGVWYARLRTWEERQGAAR